jgi:hypothetical protein
VVLVLIGFVLLVAALWLLVRLIDRQHEKKWGGAPKQKPGGGPTSIESKTAWHCGRSDGPGL